ncbi:MCE family protein [Nocardioides speluncae]|uniref:MCE family protein n=1 Tax=Nocardioides speluncae TaxID=2670337 RepID=UPI000D69C578|nr:MlaD family protein [Nocardioides speluncae]
MTPRWLRLGSLLAAVLAVLLSACSVQVPGTGPTDTPGDAYKVTAVFDDALNLTHGAPVKIGGVKVGEVTAIRADDYTARVDLAIDDDTKIPKGSLFRLRYTTALGELFVEVHPAEGGASLADGNVVQAPDAETAVTVEDTLASASLLINGGSLGQVQTIVDELNTALSGRVGATRGLLTQTDLFLKNALTSTREIDRVLSALSSVSKTLAARKNTINKALRQIRPAAKTLTDNTDELAKLLRRTSSMARSTDRVVRRTRNDLVKVVDQVGPLVDKLFEIDGSLEGNLGLANRFIGQVDNAVPTDYINLRAVGNLLSILQVPGLPVLGDLVPTNRQQGRQQAAAAEKGR